MRPKVIIYSILLILVFGLAGCSVNISTNYSPSIMPDGEGKINIENFVFLPEGYVFNSGKNRFEKVYLDSNGSSSKVYLKINQVQIDVPGTILLDKPVSDFITEAVKKEFKFIGYKNNSDTPLVLTGIIRSLSIERGFASSDFITRIDFKLVNKDRKKEFSRLSEGRFTMSEFHTKEPTAALYTSISRAIEDFVRSAQSNGAL